MSPEYKRCTGWLKATEIRQVGQGATNLCVPAEVYEERFFFLSCVPGETLSDACDTRGKCPNTHSANLD